MDKKTEELIKSAENGDVNAQLQLGKLYKSQADHTVISVVGMDKYGAVFFLHEKGEVDDKTVSDITKKYQEAGKWIKKAAERGNAEAQCVLGNMYYSGKIGEESNLKAIYWYQQAAKQGHAEAEYNLTLLKLKEGLGDD